MTQLITASCVKCGVIVFGSDLALHMQSLTVVMFTASVFPYTDRVPLQDQVDGSDMLPREPEGLSPKKKSYSVEDITAALDEIIVQDEYLRDNGGDGDEDILPPPLEYGDDGGVAEGGDSGKTAQEVADEGLDALSKALQDFQVGPGTGNENQE